MRLLCTEFWYVQADDMLVSFATTWLSRNASPRELLRDDPNYGCKGD